MTTYVSIAHFEGVEYGRGSASTPVEAAEAARCDAAAYYAEQDSPGFEDPSECEVSTFRVARGAHISRCGGGRSTCPRSSRLPHPERWYYEPEDYEGKVLWSDGYWCAYDAADAIARNEVGR